MCVCVIKGQLVPNCLQVHQEEITQLILVYKQESGALAAHSFTAHLGYWLDHSCLF